MTSVDFNSTTSKSRAAIFQKLIWDSFLFFLLSSLEISMIKQLISSYRIAFICFVAHVSKQKICISKRRLTGFGKVEEGADGKSDIPTRGSGIRFPVFQGRNNICLFLNSASVKRRDTFLTCFSFPSRHATLSPGAKKTARGSKRQIWDPGCCL